MYLKVGIFFLFSYNCCICCFLVKESLCFVVEKFCRFLFFLISFIVVKFKKMFLLKFFYFV